jgi:hypothetical protein
VQTPSPDRERPRPRPPISCPHLLRTRLKMAPSGSASPAQKPRLCRENDQVADSTPDLRAHGKEGVAGSSPAEGFRNRATVRFSSFWIGSADPFRALPSENGSSMAAGQRCALRLRPAERRVLAAQGTDAVHARCEAFVATRSAGPRAWAAIGFVGFTDYSPCGSPRDRDERVALRTPLTRRRREGG